MRATANARGALATAVASGALLLAPFGLAPASAADDAQTEDPRLEEARGHLAEPERYELAIALFREILADDPGAWEARLALARVLSWQGRYDECLPEYDRLIASEGPPAAVEIERAEVLSWAGRNDEAERAFQSVLERRPEEPRALRGLARVYLWSGRRAEAEATFERALAAAPDDAASEELASLRSDLGWSIGANTDFSADSDGFSQLRSTAVATLALDFSTELSVAMGSAWIDVERDGPAASGVLERADDWSLEGWVGVRRRFGDVQAGLAVGGRGWQGSPDRPFGRADLELPTPAEGVVTLRVEHGDFLARSSSLDAVRAGIRDTTLRLASWHPLPRNFAVFGWAESSFLDDANERLATGASLDFTPWPERELNLSLAASYLTYTARSPLYYDPDHDTSASFVLGGSQPLLPDLALDLRSEVGLGYASQGGVDGFGVNWAVQGGPRWRSDSGWWFSLRGRVSRSQRASTYAVHGGGLSAGKAF